MTDKNKSLDNVEAEITNLKTEIAGQKKQIKSKKNKTTKQFDKDHQMVRGLFKFHEAPGATLKFPYLKYKGDKVKWYELTDGHVATIPYMVASHLNSNTSYPIHKYLQDDKGVVTARVGQNVQRCSFTPLDFTDMSESVKPDIITVERV